MIKKVKYTYRGLNQDVTKSKHPFEFYYEANNIRIITTDSQTTASLQNEKGNVQILSLPQISVNTTTRTITYGDKNLSYVNTELTNQINEIGSNTSGTNVIIGYGLTRESIILFSTDSNGFDAVWKVNEIFDSNYELELLYLRSLGFSIDNPIQSIFNYESNIIQKIYWVDGKAQIRFLNLEQSIENGDLENLIDNNSTNLDITGEYSLSQPTIPQITQGGNHTAGMIQYAYNLYKLNGSQTTISPLSELVPLDLGPSNGGGELNEAVGASPLINIEDLDTRYTHIKLYAIKYTSFNQEPSVSLIVEEEIDNYDLFNYFDDGNVISTLSLAEFLFLGSNVFTPRHIETKDNRMFAAGITDRSFDFEIDARAYSHTSIGQAAVWDNVTVDPNTNIPSGTITVLNTSTYVLSPKHDAINPNYDLYRYQADGTTLGGEGRFLKYRLVQKTIGQLENQDLRLNKFFKDNEFYRIGIQFYNNLGQNSQPFWIADFKTPIGNLEGNYNTLEVELDLAEINTYIASLNLDPSEVPVGYRILRADRTANDRTVFCQGSLTGMMVQTTKDVRNSNFWKQGNALGASTNRREESLQRPKLPMLVNRSFQETGASAYDIFPVFNYTHLRMMNEGVGETDQEIYRDDDTDFKRQQTWQYLKMMQMYSPDILFNTGLTFAENTKIRVLGGYQREEVSRWGKVRNIDSGNETQNSFVENATSLRTGSNLGMYGPGNDDTDNRTIDVRFLYIYNKYSNFTFNNVNEYEVYGRPEITERGQNTTAYNGDSQFKYRNSLEDLLSDRYKRTGQQVKNENAIVSANALGSKCVTIVEGVNGIDENDRRSLVDFYNDSGITEKDVLLVAELVAPDYYVYLGNIYGGNTFEAKSRSSYLEIGEFSEITNSTLQIDSPGDTFVQRFNFGRLLKSDIERFAPDVHQVSEIMDFPVETSVNLLNRNDTSIFGWDNDFQPREEEYHQYNRVYSQQPNLIQNQAESFKFKKTNSFDTQIISSKLKVPGETVDSWTDFLENERMDLDGKYGAINALVNFKDEIYALQDQGVAHITINPRVQTQGNDGVSIELGRGGILYDYEYISTTSGTINKWSVYNSPTGFYFLDALNKSWNKYGGSGLVGLTDKGGLHAFFENNIDYTSLKEDNPLLKMGASGGYDFINNNAYLTVLQKNKSFTINFNEVSDSFESFHDYKPSIYINKGHKMYTTSPDLNKVYEHDEGEYQVFYDTKYPSTITFQVNPEADLDCVFNNIEFKSELYIDDIDQPAKTLTHISCYNEYQDSGRIPLVLNNNIKRKFREWRAQIPRNANSRDRMRNPWVFLKLELDTTDNSRFVLHDVIINYTV